MKLTRNEFVIIGMFILSLLVAVYFYPQLPENVASHWNAEGQVDGYTNRLVGAFMMPAMFGVLAVFFFLIPRIDPLKENIQKFRETYEIMVMLILGFLFFVYLQMLLWNTGFRVSVAMTVPIGVGILFVALGFLLPKAKRNWFVGIRTPWTLSSDEVWDKTHRMGGKMFIMMGVLVALSAFLGSYWIYVMLTLAFAMVLYTFYYSYVQYQKIKKK